MATHETDRQAFNAAFYALGLNLFWDEGSFARQAQQPCERQRLCDFIAATQPHLLRAYDSASLAEAILATKRRATELAVRAVSAPVAAQVGA